MHSTSSRLGGAPTSPFPQCRRHWYHWFQATGRGAKALHGDPRRFARLMGRTTMQIGTPTLFISGAADGVKPPDACKDVPHKFSGPFEAMLLDGVRHFPTREAPDAVASALVKHFGGETDTGAAAAAAYGDHESI